MCHQSHPAPRQVPATWPCGRAGPSSPGASQQNARLPRQATSHARPVPTLMQHAVPVPIQHGVPVPTPCTVSLSPHPARSAPRGSLGLTFPLLLSPRAKPSSGDHGGPLNPHDCSPPLGPACISGGNGSCCPLSSLEPKVLTQGSGELAGSTTQGCPGAKRARVRAWPTFSWEPGGPLLRLLPGRRWGRGHDPCFTER